MSTTAANAGNRTNAVIHNEEFFGGMYELVQQNSEVFNANSAGGLILVPREGKGDFVQESFFQNVDGMIQERDPDSNAEVADLGMQMDELIRVKVNKRIGPLANTRDKFLKIGENPALMSFALGQQFGAQAMTDYVNTALLSLSTAISAQGSLTYDHSAETDPTLSTVTPLIRGNRLLGDKAQRIRAYVMHSKVYHDLMEGQSESGFTNVADVIIYGGTPGSLGKPVIVTDSPDLVFQEEVEIGVFEDRYITLGLVEGSAEIAVSEGEYVTMQEVLGQQNIVWRLQGEYAHTTGVKGFKYVGAAKATNATLAAEANWEFVMHDKKVGPGVKIITA